jgi:hypothetical protein
MMVSRRRAVDGMAYRPVSHLVVEAGWPLHAARLFQLLIPVILARRGGARAAARIEVEDLVEQGRLRQRARRLANAKPALQPDTGLGGRRGNIG